MGRPAIPFDKNRLQSVISELEGKNKYEKRQSLWDDAAVAYAAAMGLESVSPVWVYLTVEKNQIQVATPKGKKGRAKGESVGPVTRTSRGDKWLGSDKAQKFFTRLEKVLNVENKREDGTATKPRARFLPILDKARKGSVKALVKLKCLDCANWQTQEIKHCQCDDCPLLLIRPYQ